MKESEIRKKFREYFISFGHQWCDSIPLVPPGDDSILFTTAGMVQFKDEFLSSSGRVKRAASIQKCFRTSDIEEVGKTARHLTFFEMYGNFSFGDYFKEEAIKFGWDFLISELALDQDKLFATVYKDDDEAFEIWKKYLPEEKIVRLGEKDNFWNMGETGPCGPCSEILYDFGKSFGCGRSDCSPGCDCDRYLEVWNLVFTQYDRKQDGTLTSLPRKNIDTGMGLERLSQVINGLDNVFQTEMLKPLVDKAFEDSAGCSEKSARIIADHARAVTFLIADGVKPSNEGRGYVLRKLIRRASREGRKSGWKKPMLWEYSSLAADIMGHYYKVLNERANHIASVLRSEEENFLQTLDRASSKLQEHIKKLAGLGEKVLSGKDAFLLYDTYGLPPDITENILDERGLEMDRKGFDEMLQESARRSSWKQSEDSLPYLKDLKGLEPTLFTGYGECSSEASVVKILNGGKAIVTDRTPMYAEAGGQTGDRGIISGKNGSFTVNDTLKSSDVTVHVGEMEGEFNEGEKVKISVDKKVRKATQRNHTCTHILQAALRDVLGDDVQQDGSMVRPEGFRFDFTCSRELAADEKDRIERKVNSIIMENYPVSAEEMTRKDAEKKGALAFFQEKYGEKVRTIIIKKSGSENISMELCGGTHVKNTGTIGLFKLVSEKGIAAGIRRIEGLTGDGALDYVSNMQQTLNEAAGELKSPPEEIVYSIGRLKKEIDELKDRINSLEQKLISGATESEKEDINGVQFSVKDFGNASEGVMRAWADSMVSSPSSAALALGTAEESIKMIFKLSADIAGKLDASSILKKAAEASGGNAGGRKDMARGGASGGSDSLKKSLKIVKEEIKKITG